MSSTTEIEHALFMFTKTFNKYQKQLFINVETFSSGLPFAHMIHSIGYFSAIMTQLQLQPDKWTQKLTNLRIILDKMETYVELEGQKNLKINDLQLVQIAKNSSQEEILKFFEVVIAVLMQTPEKQDYIQRIMGLDESSQQALVIVVQNAMQQRIFSSTIKQKEHLYSYEEFSILQNENRILTYQLNQMYKQNTGLVKNNNSLQQKILQYQYQIEKIGRDSIDQYISSQNKTQKAFRQNFLIESLKKKMIQLTREHEVQLNKLKSETDNAKKKVIQYKQIEEQLSNRNKLLQQSMDKFEEGYNQQKKRFQRILDERDSKIKKLEFQLEISKSKILKLSQDLELNDLNLRMELERRDIRISQLEKQLRSRESKLKAVSSVVVPKQVQYLEQQLDYLRTAMQKLQKSATQIQTENQKLKITVEKMSQIEDSKKKLQNILLDASKWKDAEIQMLVVSLYDLRNQNVKMHSIIQELKSRGQLNAC